MSDDFALLCEAAQIRFEGAGGAFGGKAPRDNIRIRNRVPSDNHGRILLSLGGSFAERWAMDSNRKRLMSHTVSIEHAAARLADLIGMLKPGDEIVLTDHDQPVARIVPNKPTNSIRKPGSCKGMLIINQDDDEHLDDFRE
jgi:antitoxin (DNA-binding transcriptional repressor) of toxin-antitoxin stability system